MSVQCPKCQLPTASINLESDLTVEHCDKCKGYWLDDGEMEKSIGQINGIPDFRSLLEAAKPVKFNCPKCPDQKLFEIPFQPKTDTLLIDYCKSCKGIWLDGKEFAAIREILRTHRINMKKIKAGLT